MKKLIFILSIVATVVLAGCFEITQETVINKDGSGTFSTTTDLSNMIGMLKQMGGDEAQKMQDADTTIALAGISDSIGGLTADQKRVVDKGTMHVKLNMKNEQLLINLNFPFQKLSEMQMLKDLLPVITEATMKKLPGADQVPAGSTGDSAKMKSFDDYFDVVMTNKQLKKTLNKEKYATASSNEYVKSLKQMSEMGSPITANYIINLPSPAKKAEGKALKLSEDKKRVTISVTSEDFFDDPSKFEYNIEY